MQLTGTLPWFSVRSTALTVASLLAGLLLANGCGRQPEGASEDEGPMGRPFPYSRFVDGQGKIVDLARFTGTSNVLLVFMRGFMGYICPNCTRQTAELVDHLETIKESSTEVFIVYPGPADKIPAFTAEVRKRLQKERGSSFPIPILLGG